VHSLGALEPARNRPAESELETGWELTALIAAFTFIS
jgi:hypothetical protein